LRHWLRFLARNGLAGVAEQARHIEKEIVDRFLEGHIDHDEFARRAAEAYAAVMRNQRVEEVDDWAAVFVQGPGARSIHGFAKTLVDHLIVKGIAPVIVSGAPHEIVQRHARRLGIVEAFGLRLGTTTEDGVLRFDGTIADNPGVAVRKRAIVRTLMEEEREIVLAVGDSESDQPLWDAAPLRIVVGERVLPDESDAERTLTLHPERTTWPEIARWLDARLPEETTDAGRGLVFGPLAAGDEPGTIRLPDLGEPGRILPAGIPSSSQGRARG
jgi:phosphoserine phosphatase